MFAEKRNLRPGIVDSLNKAAAVICVSESLKTRLGELGVRTVCEVIPNGVDTDIFSPVDRAEACRKLGFDPNRPRVLFVGNFVKVKGIDYLIRAMPSVLKSYSGCELILLGASPDQADASPYRSQIGEAGISGSVKVVSRVPHDELPSWMQASDMLVLSSIKEGFGLVAAEALACGIPVVATRSGGPESIVADGQGYLVPPCDHEALAEAIKRTLDGDGIKAPAMLADSAHERFSMESVCTRIMDVYTGTAESAD
jgi:glycosyltransferase involved in cell wall biosynthesis